MDDPSMVLEERVKLDETTECVARLGKSGGCIWDRVPLQLLRLTLHEACRKSVSQNSWATWASFGTPVQEKKRHEKNHTILRSLHVMAQAQLMIRSPFCSPTDMIYYSLHIWYAVFNYNMQTMFPVTSNKAVYQKSC